MEHIRQAVAKPLAITIEATPKQVGTVDGLETLFPQGTWIYLTDVGTDSTEVIVDAARRLHDMGYQPVPHLPARRFDSLSAFSERIERLAREAAVDNVLTIAGESDRQMGPFNGSLDLIHSGVLEANGIVRLGVAGHPEGSTVMSDNVVAAVLMEKAAFAQKSDMEMRIVTQFGFDAPHFIAWADNLAAQGIYLPVHLGMAGPAKMTTLIKYAAICGVGASLSFLKKRAGALATLAMSYDPSPILAALEDHKAQTPQSPIEAAHIFPFGGLKKASSWLDDRATWNIKKSLCLDII